MVLDRPDSDAGNAQKQKKILFFSESGALKFVGDLAVRPDSLNSDPFTRTVKLWSDCP